MRKPGSSTLDTEYTYKRNALKDGDVAMMDNLSSHKVDEVRQRVGKCCATLLHLSPYSQDLNSIEKA